MGSFDHKRAVIDVDRKITADFGARITSMFDDSGSYRDGVDLQRWGINPTLAFRPWDRTRHDSFSTEVTNLFPGTGAPGRFGQEDNFYSPRAGIILKPTDDVSLYASYSTTYLPASGDQFGSVTTATQKLQPEKFENYEVGLKWDVTESLAFTAEAYEVDRTNVRFAQPNGTFLQTGKSEVQGIEVTLTGNVTDRWQVAAGYGHQTGELTSATSAVLVAGTPLPLLPSDTLSLWNRYQLKPDLGVGMGVVYHSELLAALQPASKLVELTAFTTVDTALYYRINDHLRVQLNATNIFNEGYIVSAVRPGFLHLRNVSLMLLNDETITQNTDFAPRCCIFSSGRPQLRMS